MCGRTLFSRGNGKQNQRLMRGPPLRRKRLIRSNDEFSAGKKNSQNKKTNRWQLHRPHGQERSLVKREMALAEVRQREVAKKLSPFRQQVLSRMLTERRRIA